MAVYFDHRAQAPFAGQNTDLQWHNSLPLLAVASCSPTAGGCVNLYQEEGEHLENGSLRRSRQASALAWHPIRGAVAVGWETGALDVWSRQDSETYEGAPLHRAEITLLLWSDSGSRLLSGDAAGVLVVWKADARGRLQATPISRHDIQDQLTDAVFKPAVAVDSKNDIASLARAAVSGDENALDMFNWKQSRSTSRLPATAPADGACFFVGTKKGGVYFVNAAGALSQQFTADGPVRRLLYYKERSILITVSANMMLVQHSVSADGETLEMMKVKLSGKSDHPDIIWAGKGILCTCTGESMLRMWDLDEEQNYILNLEAHSGYDKTEAISCVSYCANKGILAGGLHSGHIAMWKYAPATGTAAGKEEPEDRWKLQPPSVVTGPVSDLAWGSNKCLLAVNTVQEVYVLSEQVMNAHCQNQTAVVQTGPMQLSVDRFSVSSHHDLKADIQIKGVYNTKDTIAIWNGKKMVVYEIASDNSLIRATGNFNTESHLACLYEQNVYTLEPGKIQVRNFQGTVKQLLSFTEPEGEPICMEVCGHFLVVATSKGFVKIFDLSRREAKETCSAKSLAESIKHLGVILSAKCNCTGSKVCVINHHPNGSLDPNIYIWDSETDSIQTFSFETGYSDMHDYSVDQPDNDSTDVEKGQRQAAKDVSGRRPKSVFWDATEPKLLACEAELSDPVQGRSEQGTLVVSLFVTTEGGILIQDSFQPNRTVGRLLNLDVPFFYFISKTDVTENGHKFPSSPIDGDKGDQDKWMVRRRLMRDFVGLENADQTSRDAMMNFSYFLTIGNMDEAFKAIKLIKSESVWENMAKMCVKSRRLDVAAVCLGNMGHARGARALRESQSQPELDTRVAVLALQLGLHEDAEKLLKNSKRYDLLNNFYQCSSQWEKALETAESHDRMHLRTTHYNFAKQLETQGDIGNAMLNYEKSDTHRFEVPRMLMDDTAALQSYVMKTKDKVLKKWWAQYMESTGEMETALQFYQAAQDYLSLVRVYCYCGSIDKAAEICNETGDRASCYHLARQYENNDQIREAIHFFTRAEAYGSAIRLCKDNGMEDQLMNLALLSKPDDMVEAARYYEFKPGCQDQAVTLYNKAGYVSKAMELAIRSKQFAALQGISEHLHECTDPEVLQRCADFFIENGQFDRAVDLLAVGKKSWDALKICMEQHVPMTEDLVEKLTPAKGSSANEDNDERNKILEGIAEVCMQQRQYHLATKKYTQAGNKVKAMKALLKSGDTEKIVFFAGVSRQRDIYVMAANYLQSLDWRKDAEIMKNIIAFYTKGRALDSLSNFYDACAQVEIDEYQNYDKAQGALSEAYKCLSKAKMKDESMQEEKMAELRHRIGLVKKFGAARRVYEEDSEEAIKQCQVLLQEPNIDNAVRIGDIYGFIIEHFARKEKWKVAYNCMEEMRSRLPKVNITYYVNMKTVEAIHAALDLPLKPDMIAANGYGDMAGEDDEDDEMVEEDMPNEMYD